MLGLKPEGEHQQTNVRCQAQSSQGEHDIAACPELLAVQSVFAYFGEELLVSCSLSVCRLWSHYVSLTLLATEQARE